MASSNCRRGRDPLPDLTFELERESFSACGQSLRKEESHYETQTVRSCMESLRSPRGSPKSSSSQPSRSPSGSLMSRSPSGSPMSRSPSGSLMSRSPSGSPMSRSPSGSLMSRSPSGSPMSRSPSGSQMTSSSQSSSGSSQSSSRSSQSSSGSSQSSSGSSQSSSGSSQSSSGSSQSSSGSSQSSSGSSQSSSGSSQSSSGSSQSSSGSSQSSYIAEIEPRLNLSVEEQGHVYNGAADLELRNSGDSLDSPECSPPGDAGGDDGIVMTVSSKQTAPFDSISPRRSVTPPKLELVFSPLSRGSYAASQNENSPKPRLTPRQPNLQPMQPLRKRNRPLPEINENDVENN